MASLLHTAASSGPSRWRNRAPARGAATLAVVMVLFFLVAMVAAYSNRSLIFDQRTSSNQLRATEAFEAAEAGVEWTLAQLNSGLTDNTCKPSTTEDDDAHRTFRDRYLRIASTVAATGLPNGAVTALNNTDNTSIRVRCVFSGGDPDSIAWNCTCGQRNVAVDPPSRPAGNQPAPAFTVSFAVDTAANVDQDPLPRTAIRIISIGCSQTGACFRSTPAADASSSVSAIYAHVALRPALRTQPSSALTVGGNVNALPAGGFAGGASVRLINDPQVAIRANRVAVSNGFTVVAGGTVATANLDPVSMPGTPGLASVAQNDATLVPAAINAAAFPPAGLSSADRFFVLHLGMTPDQYRRQPAVVVLDCSSVCSAAKVKTEAARNPGSPIWLTGGGGLLLDEDLGEQNNVANGSQPAARGPLMLVVEGPVDARSGVDFWGVIYGRSADWIWTVDGSVSIRGAIIGEGNFSVVAGASLPQLQVDYSDAQALGVFNFLRTRAGSYARVPAGWRDWYAE